MNIQGVGSGYQTDLLQMNTQVLQAASAPQEEPAAVFEKSEPASDKKATYEKPKASDVKALIEKYEREVSQFTQILSKYFVEQGKSYGLATKNISAQVMQRISEGATSEDIEAAKAQIAEGGFYSVEKTTDRIMDMAETLSGGDPSKIGILKDAVIKGFEQATAAWGQDLPEISQKTYDAIMARFDAWENKGKTDAPEKAEAAAK